MTKLKTHWDSVTYGNLSIKSTDNLVYRWDIEFTNRDTYHTIIGVTPHWVQIKNEFLSSINETTSYGYSANGSKEPSQVAYGEAYYTGDLVSIELDLKKKRIT